MIVVNEGAFKMWLVTTLSIYITVLLRDSLTKINYYIFSHHDNSFPEIVAFKQLFPKIGSSPGFPLLLLSSVWRLKYVNKREAVLVCSTLRFLSIIFLLVFMFFSWGPRPLKE